MKNIPLSTEEYQECLRRARMLWPENVKECTSCHKSLPLESFGGRRGRPDAPLQSWCRTCNRDNTKKSKAKNKASLKLRPSNDLTVTPGREPGNVSGSVPRGDQFSLSGELYTDMGKRLVHMPDYLCDANRTGREIQYYCAGFLEGMGTFSKVEIRPDIGNGQDWDIAVTYKGKQIHVDATTVKEARGKISLLQQKKKGRCDVIMWMDGGQFYSYPDLPCIVENMPDWTRGL